MIPTDRTYVSLAANSKETDIRNVNLMLRRMMTGSITVVNSSSVDTVDEDDDGAFRQSRDDYGGEILGVCELFRSVQCPVAFSELGNGPYIKIVTNPRRGLQHADQGHYQLNAVP